MLPGPDDAMIPASDLPSVTTSPYSIIRDPIPGFRARPPVKHAGQPPDGHRQEGPMHSQSQRHQALGEPRRHRQAEHVVGGHVRHGFCEHVTVTPGRAGLPAGVTRAGAGFGPRGAPWPHPAPRSSRGRSRARRGYDHRARPARASPAGAVPPTLSSSARPSIGRGHAESPPPPPIRR